MGLSDEILADSPYLYWKQDDPSGTVAADSSGNARVGTYVGAPTLTQPSLVSSDNGFSVGFNNTTQWIVSTTILNTAIGTVECWFEYDGIAPSGGTAWQIAGFMNGESSGVFDKIIGIDSANLAIFYAYDGGAKTTTGTTVLGAGIYHLVGVANGSTIKIYVNGVLEGTPSTCGNTYTGYSIPNIHVAGRATTSGLFSVRTAGRRDEFAVYSTVLSDERIQAHYLAAQVGDFSFTYRPQIGWPSMVRG